MAQKQSPYDDGGARADSAGCAAVDLTERPAMTVRFKE
jgi:hypothetical protein